MDNSEAQLAEYLSDVGFNQDAITKFLELYGNGKKDAGILFLNRQRSKLLDTLHESQERLYRLDYIIRKLKNDI